jgi:uncharacterized damage-inducible protein DinB
MIHDRPIIEALESEFAKIRAGADKAIAQLDAEQLRIVPDAEGNSVAVIMKHMAGNFRSRFTNFLTEDGEKPWRQRDTEFLDDFPTGAAGRAAALSTWNEGWAAVLGALAALKDGDLSRTVQIRGEAMSVARALSRALAHAAYHHGQIVLIARRLVGPRRWKTISIPRGESASFNRNMGYDASPDTRAG